MRLIELVVVACHQIGAYLFELDDGAHKHEIHRSWFEKAREAEPHAEHPRSYVLSPVAFWHRNYLCYDQYPRGIADIVGYWAEARIFGGVVVFDRGEDEDEVSHHVPNPSSLHHSYALSQLQGSLLFLLTSPLLIYPPSVRICGCTASSLRVRKPCIHLPTTSSTPSLPSF